MIWPFLVILWMVTVYVSMTILSYFGYKDPVGNGAFIGLMVFVIGGIILNWRRKKEIKKNMRI